MKAIKYQELGNLMIDSWLIRTLPVYTLEEDGTTEFVKSMNEAHWKESVRKDLDKLIKIAIVQTKERGIIDRSLDLFESGLDFIKRIPGQDKSFKLWVIYILASVLSFIVLFGLMVKVL